MKIPMDTNISDDALQSYLYFGADHTRIERGRELLLDCDTSSYRGWAAKASRRELIAEGVRCLKLATRETLEKSQSSYQALQLSGGYDSRAILGALLEELNADQIVTLTFGTPGSPDYEIPKDLARHTGVRHEQLDATSLDWDAEAISEYVGSAFKRLPAAFVLERYINYRLRMIVGPEVEFWVGFLGDTLAGAHLPAAPNRTWQSAMDRFLRKNHRSRSTRLTRSDWDPRLILPQQPLVDPTLVNLDDQLDIAIRQASLIEIPWSHFRDRYIFNHPVWKSFMLALPWHERANGSRLYLDVLARAYPKLSAFPVQGGRKRPGMRVDILRLPALLLFQWQRVARRTSLPWAREKDVMRFDYGNDLRGHSSHSVLVRALTFQFAERGLVSLRDVEELWRSHMDGKNRHEGAIMNMAGLEANLRSMESRTVL